MRKITFYLSIAALFGLAILGCAKGSNLYGEKFPQLKETAIADILSAPDSFNGKEVLVSGTIVSECPSGGWIMLKQDNAVIFVNMHPSDFAIPQVTGKKVSAWGVAGKNGPKAEIVGKGVEIK